MSDFETINYGKSGRHSDRRSNRVEENGSDRPSHEETNKQVDNSKEADKSSSDSSRRRSSRRHGSRTFRHSKRHSEKRQEVSETSEALEKIELDNEVPEEKIAEPVRSLQLVKPVEHTEANKNPFNLNILNNIGVDADTLVLLGLILLFMQEEHQDTLMVCILAYILLG